MPNSINITLQNYVDRITKYGNEFDELCYTRYFHAELQDKIQGLSKAKTDLAL